MRLLCYNKPIVKPILLTLHPNSQNKSFTAYNRDIDNGMSMRKKDEKYSSNELFYTLTPI